MSLRQWMQVLGLVPQKARMLCHICEEDVVGVMLDVNSFSDSRLASFISLFSRALAFLKLTILDVLMERFKISHYLFLVFLRVSRFLFHQGTLKLLVLGSMVCGMDILAACRINLPILAASLLILLLGGFLQ